MDGKHSFFSADSSRNLRELIQAVALASAVSAGVSHAATIHVTSNADVVAFDRECTLREAIIRANEDTSSGRSDCESASGADTIDLSSMASQLITLNGTQLPPVTSEIHIEGEGVTIDAVGLSRHFQVTSAAPLTPGGKLVLNGMTLVNGLSADKGGSIAVDDGELELLQCTLVNSKAAAGGAVYGGPASVITMTGSVLASNKAENVWTSEGALGGAIYSAGSLTLSQSTVSSNLAVRNGESGFSEGGGIFSIGSVSINFSEVGYNSADSGGGLSIDGTATLIGGTVIGNGAAFGAGGGIWSQGSLTLLGSDVLDNHSSHGGGGISHAGGTVTMHFSTVSNNSTGFSGGGLATTSAGIANSTIDRNLAGTGGGGVSLQANGVLSLVNTTVSDNDAEWGGGIRASVGSQTTLRNTTVVDNVAYEGGGVRVYGPLVLYNSIVANNGAATGKPRDCEAAAGLVQLFGVNLIEDSGVDCGLGVGPNLIDGDPLLGPLADNGGPTLTHLPLDGSPVIDAGDNDHVATGDDQRGTGFPRISNGIVDLGATEFQVLIFQDSFEDPVSQ